MGKASQERMTGHTYEERVKAAKGSSLGRAIKRLFRLNKPQPTHYANVRRHGQALVNPSLMGKKGAV